MDKDTFSEYISFNLLENKECEEFPGIYGTGFFIKTIKNIYYITARHCLFNSTADQNSDIPKLMIYVNTNTGTNFEKEEFLVSFSEYIMEKEIGDYDAEDFIIFVVDKEKNEQDYEVIAKRAFDISFGLYIDMDSLLNYLATEKKTVYIKGFPRTESTVCYDSKIIRLGLCEFTGEVVSSPCVNYYEIGNMNWKDKEKGFNGFSGSPVYASPRFSNSEPITILLGMLISGTMHKCRFLSIIPIFDSIKRIELES